MEPCTKCGQVHVRDNVATCVAHTKMGFCRKYPVHGSTVCPTHGASVKRVRAAADRRVADKELRKTLAVTGYIEPVEDPFSELAQVAGEIRHARLQLAEMVEALPSIEDTGTDKYATQLHVVMQAWKEFLQMSARVATDMSRLDLTDRIARMQAAVDQQTAAIVQGALAAALAEAPLTEPQRGEVLQAFGRRLRVGEPAALG